jgi:hypothetical protein
MAGYGDDFAMDRSRGTVNSNDETESARVRCDRCAGEHTHVLIYAFEPPSDFERWRCEVCKSIQTVRGGPA